MSQSNRTRWWPPSWAGVRDVLLFIGGMALVWYQVLTGINDPGVLVLAAGMMGLPAFLPGPGGKQ